MAHAADQVLICYQWGFLGWALVYAALSYSRGMWLGAWWYACRAGELYWLMVALTGAASWALQYVVATFLLPGSAPYPACNNNVRAAPDLAVWLLYHYWTLSVMHERFVGHPQGWSVAARRVALGVGVPVALVITDNTTWAYAGIGAAFGVALGLLSGALLLVVWAPRMAAVARDTAWTGVVHCGLRVPGDSHLVFF